MVLDLKFAGFSAAAGFAHRTYCILFLLFSWNTQFREGLDVGRTASFLVILNRFENKPVIEFDAKFLKKIVILLNKCYFPVMFFLSLFVFYDSVNV